MHQPLPIVNRTSPLDPTIAQAEQQRLFELLGEVNTSLVQRAIAAMERGDAEGLG